MTVRKHVDTYLIARKRQGAAPHTLSNLRWCLYNFAAFMGDRPIQRVGTNDVERWLEECEKLAPASRRNMLSSVRVFVRWCERRNYLPRDITAGVKSPRQPRLLPRALTGDSAERVLEACPDSRGRFIVLAMLQQGLRCCEVSNLELSDIDRQHATMRVKGKGGHERVLPLMEETLVALNDYLLEYPCTAGPLVRSYRKRQALSPSTVSRIVSEWMMQAGVKERARDGVSAHAARHTAASDMLLHGAHVRDVQAALGHAHLSSTQVYLPLQVKGLAEAMGGRSYYAGSSRRGR